MQRRNFIFRSAIAASGSFLVSSYRDNSQDISLIKPKPLSKGDTIGLVTPSSAISRTSFEKAIKNLDGLGFKVKYSDNMRVRKGFLAGTDQQRVDDLHGMFEDSEVDGIVCARGGYGSGRLLSSIDYQLIRSNAKVFIGYSDITALHFAIQKYARLITFHGPVGASEFTKFTQDSFQSVVMRSKNNYQFGYKDHSDNAYQFESIVDGEAEGKLVGGNLTLICSLMGTKYDIDFKKKLVFIEEIGESPYKVDRMLTQLLNSEKLTSAAGLILGIFNDCETKVGDPDFEMSLSLIEVLKERLGKLTIPVVYGLPFGHIADNATIPVGVLARLSTEKGTLTYLEKATEG